MSEYIEHLGIFFWLFIAAGVCTLLAGLLSAHLMTKHLRYYCIPEQQRCIVRIVSMIPIYAGISCASLWAYDWAPYLAIIRDGYESYALYMFFRLVIEYSLGEEVLIENLLKQKRSRATFPLCFMHYRPSKKTLTLCRQGVVQYVVIRPLCTIVTCILLAKGVYNEGEWNFRYGFPYISIINNIGVTVAMYFLVLLYEITKKDIALYKPLPKFLCIKMIVFVCYWQGVIIFGMFYWKIIPDTYRDFDKADLSSIINNLLICVEMVIFSLAHMYAFPYKFYQNLSEDLSFHDNPANIAVDVVVGGDLGRDAFRSFYPKKLRFGPLTNVIQPKPSRTTSATDVSLQVHLLDSGGLQDYESNKESYVHIQN